MNLVMFAELPVSARESCVCGTVEEQLRRGGDGHNPVSNNMMLCSEERESSTFLNFMAHIHAYQH